VLELKCRFGVTGGGGAINNADAGGFLFNKDDDSLVVGSEDECLGVKYGFAGDGDVAKYISNPAPSSSL